MVAIVGCIVICHLGENKFPRFFQNGHRKHLSLPGLYQMSEQFATAAPTTGAAVNYSTNWNLSNYYLQIILSLKYIQCKRPLALQYT
jgi:hypothetical protein